MIKRTVDTDGTGSGLGAGSSAATDQFFAGFEGINPTLIFDGANSGDLTNRLLSGDIVDELFADEQITNPTNAGNTLWAASDHLGTIRDLVDFNGTAYTVANHRVYDSFGNLTSETNGGVTSLFGFTGKLFDKEFKLSNHWNRWYDPALGKWISEDPIGFAAGDTNLGRYVGNRPLLWIDPSGHNSVGFDAPQDAASLKTRPWVAMDDDLTVTQTRQLLGMFPSEGYTTETGPDFVATIAGHRFPFEVFTGSRSGVQAWVFQDPVTSMRIAVKNEEAMLARIRSWWQGQLMLGAAMHVAAAASFGMNGTMLPQGARIPPVQ